MNTWFESGKNLTHHYDVAEECDDAKNNEENTVKADFVSLLWVIFA